MRAKVAKVINKACSKHPQEFKNELKRTWHKVPRPMRNKFRNELIQSYTIKENTSAE